MSASVESPELKFLSTGVGLGIDVRGLGPREKVAERTVREPVLLHEFRKSIKDRIVCGSSRSQR